MDDRLYTILDRKVASTHIKRILGDSLYYGLTSYDQYLGNISDDYDYAKLLLETLGDQVLLNYIFLEFLFESVLSETDVKSVCSNLKIEYTTRDKTITGILSKNNVEISKSLIEVLQLDNSKHHLDFQQRVNQEYNAFIDPNTEIRLGLHSYQKRIKDEVVKKLIESPNSRMLVQMPTGSGKTRTAIEAIIDFVRTRPFDEGLILWFAHSNELCTQAYETLVKIWQYKGDSTLPVFKLFGDHDAPKELLSVHKGVIFIGFQKFNSLIKSNSKYSVELRQHIVKNTQLVIIDEAHKSLANTYKDSIDYVSSMPNCRVLGLTATPGRSGNYEDPSNRTLAEYFGNNLIKIKDDKGFVVSSPISYLQEHQYLARIERKSLQVDISDFSNEDIERIRKTGELDQDEIERIVRSPIRNKLIIDEIGKALKDESKNLILVFACSVNHCILLQTLLQKEGIQSEVILSSTPKQQRDAHISGFKDGKIKVLINFGVLTTGFDAPKLKTLVIARHTNSIILYSQMIGRALRGPLNGGNEANYIIDLIDNFKTLGKPEFQFSYWEEIWDN